MTQLPAVTSFRDPFPGHLPGYLAEIERTSPGRPYQDAYDEFLMDRWQALLDSEESCDESLLQAFLERHPSLLPGSSSVDGDGGNVPRRAVQPSRPPSAPIELAMEEALRPGRDISDQCTDDHLSHAGHCTVEAAEAPMSRTRNKPPGKGASSVWAS